jgi:hypothetical protein
MAEAYCLLHAAIARLRGEAEERRVKHNEAAAVRYGLKADRALLAEVEAEWFVSRLDALLTTFAPERMGVPPWTA